MNETLLFLQLWPYCSCFPKYLEPHYSHWNQQRHLNAVSPTIVGYLKGMGTTERSGDAGASLANVAQCLIEREVLWALSVDGGCSHHV